MMLTTIIPTWCESASITEAVARALSFSDEVIVVDSGSPDGTAQLARLAGARVISSPRGRGDQLNAGAQAARGDVLLFLHADARLPEHVRRALDAALRDERVIGGTFRLRFSPTSGWGRLFAFVDDLRRRFLGMAYGDAGLFVRRSVYGAAGGYEHVPILEDCRLVDRLRRLGTLAYLRDVDIEVSDRRFREAPLRTIAVWAIIASLHALGASPHKLARLYRDIR